MKLDKREIHNIFGAYEAISEDFEVTQINFGHINKTYLVHNNSAHYILQEINTSVFHNLQVITQNIQNIAIHLSQSDYPYTILEPLFFADGYSLYQGKFRLFRYIEGAQTFLKVQSAKQAYKAAKCLSAFHSQLSNLKVDRIEDSIVGFMDFNSRYEQFKAAIKTANTKRFKNAKSEIKDLQNRNRILSRWEELLPKIPKRILHADPKISNFLFDKEDEEKVVALIDWDTLLRDYILYDFGDMVRSYTNLREEDDPEKGNNFSLENFQALKQGFLYHLDSVLTRKEKSNLILGAEAVIYIQAIRFLTDYLNNDIYYATEYNEQNLDRTKSQLNLLIELQQELK